MTRAALLVVVAVIVGGCGGQRPANDAAELVPPSAVAFVTLRSDLGSLPRVLKRFPFGPGALRAIREGLKLKPSMGPVLDLAIFKGGLVGLTRPTDEKRFEAMLGPKQLHGRIRGWTVFTDRAPLLDLMKHHEGKLSDAPSYRDALGRLPRNAIVRLYGALGATSLLSGLTSLGGTLPTNLTRGTKWTAAALSSNGNDLKLEVLAKGSSGPETQSSSELAARLPSDSVLALGLGGVGKLPKRFQVGGVDVRGLAAALGGDAIAYVRAGLPFPEVTVASKPADPARAMRDVERLVRKLAKPTKPSVPVTVDGVTLRDLSLGAVDIYYGTFDGLLVVSDSTEAVHALRSTREKLKIPGLPGSTNGFLYLDVTRALPAVRAFAKLANSTIPTQVDSYLQPLQTLLVYGTRDGDVQRVVALLQLR